MARDPLAEALRAAVEVLDELRISWAVSGSFALAYHGVLRATHDVDFKLKMHREEASLEALRRAMGRRFRVLDETTYRYAEACDVELYPLDGPIDAEAFRHRLRVRLFTDDDALYWVVAAEDLILSKLREYLRWGDYKHIDDIKKLLIAKRATLDAARLDAGLDAHPGFRDAWERLVEPGGSPAEPPPG